MKQTGHTEKTTGEQVRMMLRLLFPQTEDSEWKENYANIFSVPYQYELDIRVDELPPLDEVIDALDTCHIDCSKVIINKKWGHLTMQIMNMEVGFNLGFF